LAYSARREAVEVQDMTVVGMGRCWWEEEGSKLRESRFGDEVVVDVGEEVREGVVEVAGSETTGDGMEHDLDTRVLEIDGCEYEEVDTVRCEESRWGLETSDFFSELSSGIWLGSTSYANAPPND